MTTDFQRQVYEWLRTIHEPDEPINTDERILKVLEEICELAQASGVRQERIALIVDYVYSRDPGSIAKELGDAMTALAIFAEHHEIDLFQTALQAHAGNVQRTAMIAAKRKLKPDFLKSFATASRQRNEMPE